LGRFDNLSVSRHTYACGGQKMATNTRSETHP
jgi:hypothetical protein